MTALPTGGGPDGNAPILVRPGEGVGYCVYVMHRRKDLYGEDADEFRPERWEGDALRDIGWGYLPFNGGPRLCLGRELHFRHTTYSFALVRTPGRHFNLLTTSYSRNADTEQFAELEVSYTVCRLLQLFPYITVPDTEPVVEVGKEKQTLTLVVAPADGCRVSMRSAENEKAGLKL